MLFTEAVTHVVPPAKENPIRKPSVNIKFQIIVNQPKAAGHVDTNVPLDSVKEWLALQVNLQIIISE